MGTLSPTHSLTHSLTLMPYVARNQLTTISSDHITQAAPSRHARKITNRKESRNTAHINVVGCRQNTSIILCFFLRRQAVLSTIAVDISPRKEATTKLAKVIT